MNSGKQYNPVLLNVAMSCINAIKKDGVIDLDNAWKGRGLSFFKALI